MAKSRNKSKGIIPKRIAGVKVPKAVRRGRFGELLASKTGQAMIAQAILGAGAVAAGLKAKDNTKARGMGSDAKHKIADTTQDTAQQVGNAGSTLAYALGEAARTFADALRRGERRSFAAADEDLPWTADDGAPEAHQEDGAKKQPSAQAAPTS